MQSKKVKIKICGITNEQDVKFVNKYKPDMIGFVFASSKRRITCEQAIYLSGLLDKRILRAGVFVNEDLKRLLATARHCRLDIIQLHGDETESYIRKLQDLISMCNTSCNSLNTSENTIKNINANTDKDLNIYTTKTETTTATTTATATKTEIKVWRPYIWKSLRIKNNIIPVSNCNNYGGVDGFVLDSYRNESYGGTGKSFNWNITAGYGSLLNIILAGGLTPENVQEAINIVKPFAVDVSSGVETDGYKDEIKIKNFVNAVRAINKTQT